MSVALRTGTATPLVNCKDAWAAFPVAPIGTLNPEGQQRIHYGKACHGHDSIIPERFTMDGLSAREHQIALLVGGRGLTDKEVAYELGIS